jgi:hypothetical protein
MMGKKERKGKIFVVPKIKNAKTSMKMMKNGNMNTWMRKKRKLKRNKM